MKKAELSPEAAELRVRAETRLKRSRTKPVSDAVKSHVDSQRLLHELQVHQVELEMQNAELVESRDKIELLLDKYTDLYDFAPVGYFSLTRHGRIQEVNLTGSALLGTDRATLIGRTLSGFVDLASRPLFLEFLKTVFSASGKTACEVKLLRSDGRTFWATLHGGSDAVPANTQETFRIAVSDITCIKLAQEAQYRLEILCATNLKLKAEIVKREEIEKALRKSEDYKSRLLDESHRLHGQLRDFSYRIMETREEERRVISRDLHDEITQLLVVINFSLETLARDAAVNPEVLKQKIIRTQHVVETAVNTIHEFALKLRPTSLDDLGLIATLHSYLNDFLKRTGIRVSFKTFADVEKMSGIQRTTIYRIVQEALTNVDKHAMAQQVEVHICRVEEFVQLEISDDGKSFDVVRMLAGKKRSKHLGLIGIREQAEMVGGELTVQSTPGQGTKIIVRMPFQELKES